MPPGKAVQVGKSAKICEVFLVPDFAQDGLSLHGRASVLKALQAKPLAGMPPDLALVDGAREAR